MLRICDHPACATYTLGTFCLCHEPPVPAERFPRGRPFPRPERLGPAVVTPGVLARERMVPARAVSLEGGT
jgi:hypothetical protein